MTNQIDVTFEGDYIRVLSDGEKSIDFARRLWSEVSALCKKHNCFKVLGVANTTLPLGIMDAYDHGELFRQLDISSQYRIAWIEQNAEAGDSVRLVETVLYNRGVTVRLFSKVADAKRWLLRDEMPDDRSAD